MLAPAHQALTVRSTGGPDEIRPLGGQDFPSVTRRCVRKRGPPGRFTADNGRFATVSA